MFVFSVWGLKINLITNRHTLYNLSLQVKVFQVYGDQSYENIKLGKFLSDQTLSLLASGSCIIKSGLRVGSKVTSSRQVGEAAGWVYWNPEASGNSKQQWEGREKGASQVIGKAAEELWPKTAHFVPCGWKPFLFQVHYASPARGLQEINFFLL